MEENTNKNESVLEKIKVTGTAEIIVPEPKEDKDDESEE